MTALFKGQLYTHIFIYVHTYISVYICTYLYILRSETAGGNNIIGQETDVGDRVALLN